MKHNNAIGTRKNSFKFFNWGLAVLLAPLLSTRGSAQTYTWANHAQGQLYQTCYAGPVELKEYWPSNSLWSQSVALSRNCDDTADVISAPSNFDPAPPTGVYPGGPGAEGADVVLGAPANILFDVTITLNRLTIQTNGGAIGFGANVNVTANTFDFQGDGSLTNGGGITIASGGTLVKSGGAGTFDLGSGHYITLLTGHSATIGVNSGTLAFPAGNNDTILDGGGTFAVSNHATLIVAPDSATGTAMDGNFTGVGGGTVLLNAGMLNFGPSSGSCSLNFPGSMFQWTGGQFAGTVTNLGNLSISNSPSMNAAVYNQGLMRLADGSALSVNNFCRNLSGGTIDFQGDGGLAGGSILVNSGLIKKSAGTGWSPILAQFWNYGGTVEVDSGTLAVGLTQNDTISNATFVIQSGATFDLSISNHNTVIGGVLAGSGGGTVFMNSGTVWCDNQQGAATLNFPGAMFQWAGGLLGGESSVFLTNAGTLNLSGPGGTHGYFANHGTLIQSGAGDNNDNSGRLANQGVYEIQNDHGVAIDTFYNAGLLEKTGGSGTSVISATFNNSGAISAASGTLLFTRGAFNQNAGTLQITPAMTFTNEPFYLNGGRVTGVGMVGDIFYALGGVLAPGNPFGTLAVSDYVASGGLNCTLNMVLGGTNQFSQLAAGYASLNGTLNVTLTNGYVPAIGTEFQIISCLNRAGGFPTLNVPQGMSVNYSNNGVYLVMTGPQPSQLQSPHVSGGNFTFSFATFNGWSYTIQQNTNFATTNWEVYTNIIGDGAVYQFAVPLTNGPQSFFRVTQP